MNYELNDNEENTLIRYFEKVFDHCFIDTFTRKIYDLFVHDINFESKNGDDSYYLGVYYHYNKINCDLAKKYYIQAIDGGCHVSYAMYNLSQYYRKVEQNYNLAKKYYLQSTENGNIYGMKKYGKHYINNLSNTNDLLNYLFAIIKGNIRFREVYLFEHFHLKRLETGIRYQTIDIFCNIINDVNHINLNIEDFGFCILTIMDYIHTSNNYKLKNIIDKFMGYICKLYYNKSNNKNRKECQRCIKQILKPDMDEDDLNDYYINISQLFMEYLDHYYYKYLDEKYAPNGKGNGKTKNHFESTIAKAKNNNIAAKAMNNIMKE
jgi:hypothetical protein